MIHPYLEELMKETGEAVYLIKSESNYAINIDAVIPENKVSFAVSLNKRFRYMLVLLIGQSLLFYQMISLKMSLIHLIKIYYAQET